MIDTKPLQVISPLPAGGESILTTEALAFVGELLDRFELRRRACLERRLQRAAAIRAGERPDFRPETAHIRNGSWMVPPAPADLLDRRVEITGPVDRKMMINALNSGAKVFMADLEDALSPTWTNVVAGQVNLADAVRGQLRYDAPDGRSYVVGDRPATLVVRPRGWHMVERHVLRDGQPISASLFDFGLYFFHNARRLVYNGTGPYFYLPKLESHEEAQLWNDVFVFAQEQLGLPRGTIRATVLIETILAAFEMDEILHALGEHATGLNAGRWDYLFSIIKRFGTWNEAVLPNRADVTMAVSFMKAYCERLVQVCHKRGAHAIGGMAAFIPSRKDPEVTERAIAKVRADKEREVQMGFDGTWVAHPDLVPVAQESFDRVLGEQPNQLEAAGRPDPVPASALLEFQVPGGQVTEEGLLENISVALQYLSAWLGGQGAVAIHHLMEDAATAEISRTQIWQWIRHGVKTSAGRLVTGDRYLALRVAETERLRSQGTPRITEAAALLDELILSDDAPEFLTHGAYLALDD